MNNQRHRYKISIGFPVFNVEKYVYESLASILDQNFDDFEVIVVDDCGTDRSMEIIQKLKDVHPKGNNVRIIKHEKNAGLAEARNTAIKNARSKYIYFVDSDDRITPNALSTFYNAAERYQAEVVIGSNFKQKEKEIWVEDDDLFPSIQFLKEGEFTSYLYQDMTDIMPSTAWNILFSMDFLNKNHLLFPNIRFQEDIAFDELYHPCIQKIVFLSDLTYYYLLRANSLMNVQARNRIGINEVERSVKLCKILKTQCKNYADKTFYGGVCAKTMRRCFFQVAGILKHRERFTEHIDDKVIRNIMKHPESLFNIMKFKQLRIYNLFYYFIGILPPKMAVTIMRYICQKKGYLKTSLQTTQYKGKK